MNYLRENNFWKPFYCKLQLTKYRSTFVQSTFSLDHRKCLKNRGKCYMGHSVYVYLYLHISYMCVYVCSWSSSRFTIVVQLSKENPRCADRSRNRLLETIRTYRFGFYQLVFHSCAYRYDYYYSNKSHDQQTSP